MMNKNMLKNKKRIGMATATMTKVSGNPDRVTVALKYVQIQAMSTSSTGYNNFFFRLNSVYDPNYTGGGHQPTAFDNWAAFYVYYRVMRTKAKVTICDGPTGVGNSAAFAIRPTISTATQSTLQQVSEDARAQCKGYNPNGPPQSLEGEYDIRSLFGVTKDLYGQEPFSATVTTNPSKEFYLGIYVENMNGLGGTFQLIVELEYIVEFYQRFELEPSLLSELMLKERKNRSEQETHEPPPVSGAPRLPAPTVNHQQPVQDWHRGNQTPSCPDPECMHCNPTWFRKC